MLHAIISTVGSFLAMLLIEYPIMAVLGVSGHRPRGDVWYGIHFWLPGLVLGFLISRIWTGRSACMVWMPGLLWLAVGLWDMGPRSFSTSNSAMTRATSALFPMGNNECGSTECLGFAIFTIPALNSLTYSAGAALGVLARRRETDETS